jgi:hypothetical protein
MASKSSAGWLILLLALAVPGMPFYQWYSHLDKAQKKEFNNKVRVRIPDGGPFANDPNKNKLVNPIHTEPAVPLANAPAAPLAAPPVAVPPVAGGPTPAVAADATGAGNPASAAPAVSSAPATNVFLSWRDPTLSPYDQVRLEEALETELRRQQELRDAAQGKKRAPAKVKREPPIENKISLQGIVGKLAIVNGESVSEGDMVGQVKVLRITSQEVIFGYKGRRFSKSVNQ